MLRYGKGIEVNVLQIDDDTLFVCKAKKKIFITIKTILRCFELVSELKVNYHKTRIAAMGIGKDTMENFSRLINYSSQIRKVW